MQVWYFGGGFVWELFSEFQKFGGAVSQKSPSEKSNKSMKNCLQLSI